MNGAAVTPLRQLAFVTRRTKRLVLIAADPWLRLRLERELKRAGGDVVSLDHLPAAALPGPTSYDVILVDVALLAQNGRGEALTALRAGAPRARFILLAGPDEQAVAEQAESNFDLILERPIRAEGLSEVVWQALSDSRGSARDRAGSSEV